MPSTTARVKRALLHAPVLRVATREAVRQRAIATILASGLFDRAWYEAQAGQRFRSRRAACVDYVSRGRRAGRSPHPLFEPSVAEPRTWQTRGTDPLMHYLRSPWRRTHAVPHVLFDPARYLADHPEAADFPTGTLGHFVATAGPDTLLPVEPGPGGPVRWGQARAVLLDAVAQWRRLERVRAPRQVNTYDRSAEQAFRAGLAPVSEPPNGGQPLVSVILPTWNRAGMLRRAVESVRAQTLRGWELIVIDDGSTDDTPAVLAGLTAFEPRIRVVTVEHGGVSRARNAGIAAAAADHVAFLDSDNTWQPDFLATMLAGISARGHSAAYSAMELRREGGTSWRAFEGGREFLLAGNHIDLNVLVARTSLVREVGGFDERLRRAVDYDLVLRLSERTEIGYLPFVGAIYRESAADLSRISNSEPLSFDTVVRARHGLDWAATRAVARRPDTISVIIALPADTRGAFALLDQLANDSGAARPGAAQPTVDELPAPGPELFEPSGEDDRADDPRPADRLSPARQAQEPVPDELDPDELDPDELAADELDPDERESGALREGADPVVAVADPGDVAGRPEIVGAAVTGERPAPDRAADPDQRRLDIVLVDAGGTRATAVALAATSLRDDRVQVVRSATPLGTPYAVNLALSVARGQTVAVVEPRHTLEAGWLSELTAPLSDPDVLATGLPLLARNGSVITAGAVFTADSDLPVPLLAGQPGDEATQAGSLMVSAPWSAALAVRTADLVAVDGLDPLFASGLWDVDLGLRLRALRPGRCVTATGVSAIATGPLPQDGPGALWDQKVLQQRWSGATGDDASAAWAATGIRLAHVGTTRLRTGVAVSVPVVVRDRALVPDGPAAGRPSLRWVVQTAAPAGPTRLAWGDWHFAQSLAGALRRLGQQVVVEPRDTAPARPAAALDDVVLTLRGLTPLASDPAVVNLLWVISHPDEVAAAELTTADHVFAASIAWSERMSAVVGRPVEPLLQCTDPQVFAPGRPLLGEAEPVLFVGNSRRVMRPVVEQALAVRPDLAVWGGGWHGLIPEHNIRGTYIPNAELSAHYGSAGVVLNDHWDDMRTAGFISNRLFDIVASGGRAVSDDVAGLTEVFGDAVVAFDTPDQLGALLSEPVDGHFGDDARRVAAAGRVARSHSFQARAERLLEVALDRYRGG